MSRPLPRPATAANDAAGLASFPPVLDAAARGQIAAAAEQQAHPPALMRDAAGAGQTLDAPGLTALATQIDGRMQSAGRVLADVLQALDLISGQLDSVREALADEAAIAALGDLGRFAEALSALPARRAERMRLLTGATETRRRLLRSVAEVRQILQALQIYGLNVTIAAASSDHSDDLIRSMSERLVQGGGHVRVFGQRLDAVRKALDSLVELDETLGRECARVVPAVPDRLREAGRALDAHQHALVDLGRQMQSLVGSVRARVAEALGALQIGDSTRQRIEHVADGAALLEAMLAGLDDSEAAAASAAGQHLLAAQLRAAADALDNGATALAAILDALAPEAAVLRRLREEGPAGAAGAALLQQLQTSVGDSEMLTQRLRAADGQTGAVTQLIGETVEALSASLGDIAEIRSDVHHMAINIGLRYRGEDGVGAAARVVASEINLYSRRLDEEGHRIAQAIAALATLSASLDDAVSKGREDDGGGGLAAVVAVIGRGTRAGQGEVNAARRAVDGVLASLAEAGDMLSQQTGFAADLRRMAGPCLPAPPTPQSPAYESGFLRPLYDRYTMAEERRLHATLIGASPPQGSAASEPEDDWQQADDAADFTLF